MNIPRTNRKNGKHSKWRLSEFFTKTSYQKWKEVFWWMATLTTIFGIGFLGIIQPLEEKIPFIYLHKWERNIEKIRPNQSFSYIKSIFGEPQVSYDIELPAWNKHVLGEKRIWGNDIFLLVTYFSDTNSLLGYIIISKNENFNPRMPTVFANEKTNVFDQDFITTEEKSNGTTIMLRNNCTPAHPLNAEYYLEMYYWHIGNYYYGVAITDVGCIKNRQEYESAVDMACSYSLFNDARKCLKELNSEKNLSVQEELPLKCLMESHKAQIIAETRRIPFLILTNSETSATTAKMLNSSDEMKNEMESNQSVKRFRKLKPNAVIFFDPSIDVLNFLEQELESGLGIMRNETRMFE